MHQDVEKQNEHTRALALPDQSFMQLAHTNLANDQDPSTSDNKITIFNHGRDKFDALLKDLRQAESYIHLLYFIFRTDLMGEEILGILAGKAEAGVDV